jgi:hypothetical protein
MDDDIRMNAIAALELNPCLCLNSKYIIIFVWGY